VKHNPVLFHYGALVVLGASWGFTVPLSKIAVSTGYGAYGLIFWQLVIGVALMGAVIAVRGTGLSLNRGTLRAFVVIAFVGTILPDGASYRAFVYLPAGVMSILLSLVPMIAFPIALGLRLERFGWMRFIGLLAGLGGVLLLVLPEASLPDAAMLAWIPLALVAPLCYAFEGNYVSKWGIGGMDAVQVLFGASLVGAILTLPVAVGTGQFINPFRVWAAPEWALVASAAIHVVVYAGYVWLVGRAGSVFAVQVSYLVTGFGVFWAMIILGESYSSYIWAAFAMVLLGAFLVRPRGQEALAPPDADGQDQTQQQQRAVK
jgi:drug/metabolite transporter (DMT)-like permease